MQTLKRPTMRLSHRKTFLCAEKMIALPAARVSVDMRNHKQLILYPQYPAAVAFNDSVEASLSRCAC